MVVDDQARFPLKKEGIAVASGSLAKIKVSKTFSKMMPYPFSACIETNQINTFISRLMSEMGLAYNRRNCLLLCQQKINIEKFGCYDLRLPGILNAPPCNTREQFISVSRATYNLGNWLYMWTSGPEMLK